jgi:hypothetical protein
MEQLESSYLIGRRVTRSDQHLVTNQKAPLPQSCTGTTSIVGRFALTGCNIFSHGVSWEIIGLFISIRSHWQYSITFIPQRPASDSQSRSPRRHSTKRWMTLCRRRTCSPGQVSSSNSFSGKNNHPLDPSECDR